MALTILIVFFDSRLDTDSVVLPLLLPDVPEGVVSRALRLLIKELVYSLQSGKLNIRWLSTT